MKKLLVLSLVLAVSLFAFSCKKKVKTTPEPQPAVEKVEKVEEPAPKINPEPLSEEELFQKKTIEELNKEGVLKNVLFDFDKYNVREDQVPVVDGNAGYMKKFSTVKVLVEGHCDERGTEEYNMALGEKRAKSVKDYLVSLGIAEDRISVVSYGKTRPIDPSGTEEAFNKNSRAESKVTAK